MTYELIQKQAFLTDLLLLEKSTQKKVPHATGSIRQDPFGPHCKKIFKYRYKNLYRYRIGDHRLCYAVGTGCVALLAVGPRRDVYERLHADPHGAVDFDADLGSATLKEIPTAVEDPIPEILPNGGDSSGPRTDEGTQTRHPARQLLGGFLGLWKVPEVHHDKILSCGDPDDLLDLDLPDETLEKLLHCYERPTIDQVIEQPSYELPDVHDLERYTEGSLSGFLLRLDPEQKKAVDRGSAGPLLVRGGPGTGKSIVALYRIRNLFAPDAQRELFSGEPPRVLFVTFTRALTNLSAQLLKVLIGGEAAAKVNVKTLDSMASELLRGNGSSGRLMGSYMKDAAVEAAKVTTFTGDKKHREYAKNLIGRLEPEYLMDEFDWAIEGQGLKSVSDYLKANRAGRGIGFDKRAREIVWSVYETWKKILKKQEGLTFTQAQREALDVAFKLPEDEKYDVVVLDEAQDLKPVGIRLAMALAKSPRGFYMTADACQSIYGRGFTWKSVSDELRLAGRSYLLRRNYRSTEQIQEAAKSFLRWSGLDEQDQESTAVRTGPKPLCQECANGESTAIAQTLRAWSQNLRMPVWMSAVLVRSRREGERVAEELGQQGLDARWVPSKELDIEARFIKVMTLHSAKGLEFPMVAIAGVRSGLVPMRSRESQDSDDYAEFVNQERRLFHVGLSRAMRRLMITFPRQNPSQFVAELDTDLWDWKDANQ